MKKALSIIIIGILICSFVACSFNNSSENVTTDIIVQKSVYTTDSILELFNNDYNSQKYTSDIISDIITNIENNGIILNGNITTVVHLTKKESQPEASDWSWAYVYEFTEESDAIAFEENRRTFVEATEKNGMCIRSGLIVVFGSAPAISSIAHN